MQLPGFRVPLQKMKRIQEKFEQILIPFPKETIEVFAAYFEVLELKKDTLLLQENKICKHLFFISKGASMCFYIKNGKRYVDEFSLENEFITDYTSFLTQQPSDKNIILLEDSEIYQTTQSQIQEMYTKGDYLLERLGRVMGEQLFMAWHKRSKGLLMNDAKERYEKLIEKRPALPQRVPQYLIAEYLNITPESLSRIRSKRKLEY